MESFQQIPQNARFMRRRFGVKELNILTNLRKNARVSLTSISRKTKIPVSTIFDKMKVSYNGVITRYTALLDFAKIGFNTKANILLRFGKNDRDKARDFLVKNCFVNSIYKVNNGYDFLVEAIFSDLKGLENFMESLDSLFELSKSEVYYVIEDVKREGCLSEPEYVGKFIKEHAKSF